MCLFHLQQQQKETYLLSNVVISYRVTVWFRYVLFACDIIQVSTYCLFVLIDFHETHMNEFMLQQKKTKKKKMEIVKRRNRTKHK